LYLQRQSFEIVTYATVAHVQDWGAISNVGQSCLLHIAQDHSAVYMTTRL